MPDDTAFQGSIPRFYQEHLVPLIFEPYAQDLAARLASRKPRRVLEIAAGTGVVTRQLARALPAGSTIVATDLNQAMLDQAATIGTPPGVRWQQADAMRLAFDDASFDAVVCQFGVMFFPDRGAAHAQVRRVLAPGGVYLFNVWDAIEHNEFADVITRELARHFRDDPPLFLARTPYGYFDRAVIARDLAAGGFDAAPVVETVTRESVAASPRDAVLGLCQGSPLRAEIEARAGADRLEEATQWTADAVRQRFGAGPVRAKIQAIVVEAPAPG